MVTTPNTPTPSTKTSAAGVLPRLVRSFSKSNATTASTSSTANAHPGDISPATPNSAQLLKKTPLDNFFNILRKQKKPEFPPLSWFINREEQEREVDVTIDSRPPDTLTREDVPIIPTSVALGEQESRGGAISPMPEPDTLAWKIQAMISSLPSLSIPSASFSNASTAVLVDNTTDTSLPPTPSSSSFLTDSKVFSFLSSSSIMNGSIEKGQQSVWSVLDRLRPPSDKKDTNAAPYTDEQLDCDDNSSVMMYGPLEPTEGSEVEIAFSEVVSINGDGEETRILEQIGSPRLLPIPLPMESIFDPPPISQPKGKAKEEDKSKPVKEYRVWLPSSTKISIQTTWWGFKIYLPPPVLDVLNSKQLEAAKRAAMITAALRWLLDHLPVTLMPPPFHPAMFILKRLVPYLSYIGGFIAWSWSAVKSFDKGHGVILTATWLLPIALIPGTWELSDVPQLSPMPPPSQQV